MYRKRRYYKRRYTRRYRRTGGYTRRALPNARALTPTIGTFVPDDSSGQGLNAQTLSMINVALPDMATAVGARRSSFIFLKGIKFNYHAINTNNFPLECHMAIVQDRDNNNSDLDRRQNFFRDTTNTTARAHPFNDWTVGDNYDFRMIYNNINSDHYNVITHFKFYLDGRAEVDRTKDFLVTRRKYFKINRRIAFDNTIDTVNWRPFYVCIWWLPRRAADLSTANATGGFFFNYKTDVVYKNIL